MRDFKGKHVWFELNTTDLQAAEAFYADVIGWVPRDSGMPGMQYTMVGPAEHAVGGMMALTGEMQAAGACPGWTGYVAVDDVDAAAAQTDHLGGRVCVPPRRPLLDRVRPAGRGAGAVQGHAVRGHAAAPAARAGHARPLWLA
jgi:uncharacterized protein